MSNTVASLLPQYKCVRQKAIDDDFAHNPGDQEGAEASAPKSCRQLVIYWITGRTNPYIRNASSRAKSSTLPKLGPNSLETYADYYTRGRWDEGGIG